MADSINPAAVADTVWNTGYKLNSAWRDLTDQLGAGGQWMYRNTGKLGFGLMGWLLGQRLAGRGKGREGLLRRLLGGAIGTGVGLLGENLWNTYRPRTESGRRLDSGELAGRAASGVKNWLAGGK